MSGESQKKEMEKLERAAELRDALLERRFVRRLTLRAEEPDEVVASLAQRRRLGRWRLRELIHGKDDRQRIVERFRRHHQRHPVP